IKTARATTGKIHWRRGSSFQTKIKLGNTWNPRHVNSSLNRGLARIPQWGNLILGKSVSVEGEPVPPAWYAVAEVNSRAPISRICCAITPGSTVRCALAKGIALDKIVESERARSSGEHNG